MTITQIEARRDALLTVKEYASVIRVCDKSVYRRIWNGTQAGAYRVGGQWRIDLTIALRPVQSCTADTLAIDAVA